MKHFTLTLTLLACIYSGHSQDFKDLIVTETNDSIRCTITLMNDNNFFYDHKVKRGIVNDMIPIGKIKYYNVGGKKLTPIVETAKDTTARQEYNGEKYIFCQIVGTAKPFTFNTQLTISIDYGQERKFWKDERLRDENGKVQSFNSMIDALNYMGNQGWEFAQAYTVTMGNTNVYHYLLKREK